MELPLKGVRVLAIEQYGAGPFGTQHLADLGAEVIKIENQRMGGDYARSLGPYFVDGVQTDDASLFFQSVNRNKKSLTLDLSHADARPVIEKLVAWADAIANNLRGDVPEKLGIDYKSLKHVNPAIVCAHCSAYGRHGPRKSWPGYDFLMQAESGYFHMSGEPDSAPTRMGLSIVDFMAGSYMAMGLLAAVIASRTTGLGRDVDVSLYATAISNYSYLATWTLNSEFNPTRVSRSAHASLVPCQLYRTGDGWLFIMCNKEKFWIDLCNALAIPEVGKNPRYSSYKKRLDRRDELTDIIDEALSVSSTSEWLIRLQGTIPVAPVRSPREALLDPALREMGMVQSVKLTNGVSVEMLKNPIHMSCESNNLGCPPMGNNSKEILHQIGYTAEEIARFHESGLI